MKHILLPTDFSKNAWNAIFTTLKLYSDVICTFYLLNVYEPRTKNILGSKSSIRAGMVYESMQENSQKELGKILGYINEHYINANHSFEIVSRHGYLENVIKDLVQKNDLDIIVMGTKGATGAKKVFMGSNAVKTIKTVNNCPILVVPGSFNFLALKTIVLPSEYSHFFPKNCFSELVELAKLWQSKVLIFHVAQEFKLNDDQQVNIRIMKQRLRDLDYSFHKVNIKSTVAKAVSAYCDERKADMIVLIHYEHTFMEKLTQEPVVAKVGFNTKIPLLVLPERN